MLGSLLAAHYVAKKPWGISAIFWAILIAIGLVTATAFSGSIIFLMILGFIIFMIVAMYYLKTSWWMSIILYIVALLINIVISYVLNAFGVVLPW
jgi:hypothetical protein